MSMLWLGDHRTPKGAVTSPTRRAILQHLQMNGEQSTEQLHEAFKNFTTWRISAAHEPPKNMGWLDGHLRHLRSAGHLSRRIDEAVGKVFWKIGSDAVAVQEVEPDLDDERCAETVAPRQVNLMHGPVYAPPVSAPARPGAMDFSKFPSLMGQRRVAYRSGS